MDALGLLLICQLACGIVLGALGTLVVLDLKREFVAAT